MNIYTRVEAAEYLGVSVGAVRYYMNKNLLSAIKKGKTWLIAETDLLSFKDSDWFKNRIPGQRKQIYPDDMPMLHLFVGKSRLAKIKAQKKLELKQ